MLQRTLRSQRILTSREQRHEQQGAGFQQRRCAPPSLGRCVFRAPIRELHERSSPPLLFDKVSDCIVKFRGNARKSWKGVERWQRARPLCEHQDQRSWSSNRDVHAYLSYLHRSQVRRRAYSGTLPSPRSPPWTDR